MKKINILLATFALAILSLSSCSDDYLDTTPTSSVSDQTIYSTADNLMVAINGMHRNMYYRQNSSQGQNGYTAQMIISDAMGEDVVFPSSGNSWFRDELRWISQNNPTASTDKYPWNFWYYMIKNANNIIAYGQNATGDQDLKNQAIGEAYAYVAFGYFQLVQTYGKRYDASGDNSNLGVIIRDDPNDVSPKARSTVEDVYTEIWKNLDLADEYLQGKSVKNNSHFTESTILGLKARVALVQQDYTKAAEYANKAKESYTLMSQPVYKQGFNDYTNPEWMWGITIQSDQSDYYGNFMAYMSRNYNSTHIRTTPKAMSILLYNAFPKTDVRTQVVDPTGKHEELDLPSNFSKYAYTSQKFLAQSTSSSLGDVPFMRAAEMYLIEAEALYKLGKETDSKNVLSELVSARDSSFSSFTTTGDEYYKDILLNRRIELWGEGFRFFDLKRLNQGLDRTGSNHVATVINNVYKIEAGAFNWQWLIPQDELNSNSLCVQNPSS